MARPTLSRIGSRKDKSKGEYEELPTSFSAMRKVHSLNSYDKEQGGGERLTLPEDFDGPTEKRHLTDPLFSLLILLSWGVAGYIGYWAFNNGDPITIIHPTDYRGRYCGLDKDMENGQLLPPYYIPVDILGNGICVSECPQESILRPANRSQMLCKEEKDLIGMLGCSFDGVVTENLDMLVICGGCMFQTRTFKAMDFCIPNSLSDVFTQIDQAANATGFDPMHQLNVPHYIPYIERFINDVWINRQTVLIFGLGGSVVAGFLFLFLLRIPGLAASLVWGAAMLTPAALFFGAYWCRRTAALNRLDPMEIPQSESMTQFIQYLSYILFAIAVFFLMCLAFLRRRIMLAISITKAATKAVTAFPMSVFYPIIQMLGYLALVIPWCVFMIFLAGTGKPVEKTQEIFSFDISYTSYQYTNEVKYSFWFMLFVLFWTSEFIVAMGQITLAMCYSKWYFTIDKKAGIDSSVSGCMCLSFFYHMGTAAFGSMILAFIRWVRAILMWVQKKVRDSGINNKAADAAFCCCQCALMCLEKCLKYLSKNAYIQTALFSYSFCKASRESFYLIFRNSMRMFAVGIVSELTIIFCRLFIISAVSVATFFYMTEKHAAEVVAALSVVSVVAIISWFISHMFMEVLGIAITTMMQCFLADEEMHPDGSYYVPKELDDFLEQIEQDEHDLEGK